MPIQLDKNGHPIYDDPNGTLEQQRLAAIQASLAQDTGYADQVMQPTVQANNYQNVQANLAAQQPQQIPAQYQGPQTSPYVASGGAIKMAEMQNAQSTPQGMPQQVSGAANPTQVGGPNAGSNAVASSGYLDPRQLDTNTLDQSQIDKVSQQAAQGDQDSASALDYLKTAGLVALAAGAGGAYVLIRNMGKDAAPPQGMLSGPGNQALLSGPKTALPNQQSGQAALSGPVQYTDFEDVTGRNQLPAPGKKLAGARSAGALPKPGPVMQGRTSTSNVNRAQTPDTIAVRGERYLPPAKPSREQEVAKVSKAKAAKRQKSADINNSAKRVGRAARAARTAAKVIR